MRKFLIWLVRPFVKDADIRSLMVDISGQKKMDRYRDFIKVFGSPEGQRVLTQILVWGHSSRGHYVHDMSAEEMFFKEGERNLALRIVAALTEPSAKPEESEK